MLTTSPRCSLRFQLLLTLPCALFYLLLDLTTARLVQQNSLFVKNLNVGYFSHLIGLYSCVDPIRFVQHFPCRLQSVEKIKYMLAPCILSCSLHLHAFWDFNLLFWNLKSNLPLCAQTRTFWRWFGGLQKLYFEFACWKYWAKGNVSLVCPDHCGFHIVHLTDFLPSLIMPGKVKKFESQAEIES